MFFLSKKHIHKIICIAFQSKKQNRHFTPSVISNIDRVLVIS